MHKALPLLAAFVPSTLLTGVLGYCPAEYDRNIDPVQEKCLATMIYGEARGESLQGQVAVAFTALNRAGKAANKTVCNVVLAPKQYSIFNDNPALYAAATNPHIEPKQKNEIDQESWLRAVEVAAVVMRKKVEDPTFGATHYLAPKLMAIKQYKYPKWSRQYTVVAIIGDHKFYKPGKTL